MESGKKKKTLAHLVSHDFQVRMADYKQAHANSDCGGKFHVQLMENILLPVSGLGAVKVPYALMVVCEKCDSAYVPEGFQRFLEESLAVQIILEPGLLNKGQIRFLRLTAGFSQEDVAKGVGATDKSYYLKLESPKYSESMSVNMQVRLKLFYAKHFKIKDPEQLLAMNEPLEHAISIEARTIFSPEVVQELQNLVKLRPRAVSDRRKSG